MEISKISDMKGKLNLNGVWSRSNWTRNHQIRVEERCERKGGGEKREGINMHFKFLFILIFLKTK